MKDSSPVSNCEIPFTSSSCWFCLNQLQLAKFQTRDISAHARQWVEGFQAHGQLRRSMISLVSPKLVFILNVFPYTDIYSIENVKITVECSSKRWINVKSPLKSTLHCTITTKFGFLQTQECRFSLPFYLFVKH